MKTSPYSIKIVHGLQGAAQACGVAVIIDVLRAFSTACYVVAAGARRLLAVADADAARQLAVRCTGAILIGERQGRRIPGFDMGNCPSQVPNFDWRGRTAILTTSNGTQGVAAAHGADQVLTGSFVNANALVAYIQRLAPTMVSLVCMGSAGRPALEDTLCAHYLQAALLGAPLDFEPLREQIRKSPEGARFTGAPTADMPAQDLELCLALDRFKFILRAEPGPDESVALARVSEQSKYFQYSSESTTA